jgi:uncharacterized protein YndB with AHSA1/START domain
VSAPATGTRESEVRITRVFDAPRERVFAAWTEAPRLAQWFAPGGFSVIACEAGPDAGSAFRICLRSGEGRDYWVRGTYREIERPARLVIACTAEDEHGKPRLEELIEVTLTALRGKTTLRLRASTRAVGADAAASLGGMPEMWARAIDRLNSHVVPK